jgi:hypothetical protein
MVYAAFENGRSAHGSGPMARILRRIHRIFGIQAPPYLRFPARTVQVVDSKSI